MHEDLRRRLATAVLNGEGDTSVSLREQIYEFTAQRSGSAGDDAQLPGVALPDFVDTVACRAHESTSAQVQALRDEGYSDDAIFEITVTTAAAAGIARLERALEALSEDPT